MKILILLCGIVLGAVNGWAEEKAQKVEIANVHDFDLEISSVTIQIDDAEAVFVLKNRKVPARTWKSYIGDLYVKSEAVGVRNAKMTVKFKGRRKLIVRKFKVDLMP